MPGYPEYYTIVYRDDQRMIILNENPEKRKAPPKRGYKFMGNPIIGRMSNSKLENQATPKA